MSQDVLVSVLTDAVVAISPVPKETRTNAARKAAMILLDGNVMIDILRKHSPAVAWLQASSTEALGLPGLVVMELLQG